MMPEELKTGVVVGQRYRIINEIGQGAQAFVYSAQDILSGKKVAIKVLNKIVNSTTGYDYEKRFEMEISACRKISHENIVRVYDSGKTGDGRLFTVMDLIEASPLDEVICMEAPFEETKALHILRQILRGLEYCHGINIIHRDLKPSNIMVDSNGTVVIVDFGLARDFDRTTLTRTDVRMGTPMYFPPEVIVGGKHSKESDYFSLGIIVYQMLCGEHPFRCESLSELANKLLTFHPPSIVSVRTDIASQWDDVVCGFLVKPPAQRLTAGEKLNALLEKIGARENSTDVEDASVVHKTAPAIVEDASVVHKTAPAIVEDASVVHKTAPAIVGKGRYSVSRIGVFLLIVLGGYLFLRSLSAPQSIECKVFDVASTPVPGGAVIQWKTSISSSSALEVLEPFLRRYTSEASVDGRVTGSSLKLWKDRNH